MARAARPAKGALNTAQNKLSFAFFASKVALWCGSPMAFGLALAIVIVWAVTGPFFGFSETWQIVINTGTTIITFLMVFVIQSSQNRDGMALQLKLDEIIRSLHGARNSLVDAEEMDEEQLEHLRKPFHGLAHGGKNDEPVSLQASTTLHLPPAVKRVARKAAKVRKP